jgi:hypothetical protein
MQSLDSFGSIDLADPRPRCGDEPAVRDRTHRGYLAPTRACLDALTLVMTSHRDDIRDLVHSADSFDR